MFIHWIYAVTVKAVTTSKERLHPETDSSLDTKRFKICIAFQIQNIGERRLPLPPPPQTRKRTLVARLRTLNLPEGAQDELNITL